MRTIDILSDILDVKKGFKQPLKSCNQIVWNELIVNLIEYLLTLKSIDGASSILEKLLLLDSLQLLEVQKYLH